MKVSFACDDGYLIELLQKIFKKWCYPAWKEKFCLASFFGKERPWTSRHGQDSVRFDFSGSSPCKNYHHFCGYFSFVRFLSVAWPYNYYTHNFSCGDILIDDWPCYTTSGHWITQQTFLMYTNAFWLAVSLHLRSQIVFPGMESAQMRPHQNAFCTLVYMIKCIMNLICVLDRMQWVLFVYTTCQSNDESELIIKIIGKYISLCNSFALSCTEFIFGKEVPWHNRHQPHTSLLW